MTAAISTLDGAPPPLATPCVRPYLQGVTPPATSRRLSAVHFAVLLATVLLATGRSAFGTRLNSLTVDEPWHRRRRGGIVVPWGTPPSRPVRDPVYWRVNSVLRYADRRERVVHVVNRVRKRRKVPLADSERPGERDTVLILEPEER